MVAVRSAVGARDEFLAVVLADPDLLDLAFAEVVASWETEPPKPPVRTLVATSEQCGPPSRAWRSVRTCRWRHTWLPTAPHPDVARSPPEWSVPGCRVDRHGALTGGSARVASGRGGPRRLCGCIDAGGACGPSPTECRRRWSIPTEHIVWTTNPSSAGDPASGRVRPAPKDF